jgi:beta-galactosidase
MAAAVFQPAGQLRYTSALMRLLLLALLAVLPPAAAQPAHTFSVQGEHFLLDGKPFVIVSGEMHYPRVPREYWRDRMRKMKAMGLNTLCTYIFWNLHEPARGTFDFRGDLDVAEFVRTAQQEGLWVIVRPGPYICTEWDFGGLPWWLFSTPGINVRSADPRFLAAAAEYMKQAGAQLAPLQITRGGPIIMAQVENEYGSFGKDHGYMSAVRKMMLDAGFEVPLYTSDGPSDAMLAGGTLPGTLAVINFGAGEPAPQFDRFAGFRQNVPRMSGEYWIGWFDHWGEQHHTTSAEKAASGLDWMLANGISVNLYMFHGGTSFGPMSGANFSRAYQPDISSYDYDSPLDEAGRPTAKFFALRDVIAKHLKIELPALPPPLPAIEIPRFELKESAPMLARLPKPVHSARPQAMEALGQGYGFVLYRHVQGAAATGTLEAIEARDYALVLQGARTLGSLDRRLRQTSLHIDLRAGEPLDILVENMGRINFAKEMATDRKGITEKVMLAGAELTGWDQYALPLAPPASGYSAKPTPGPAFYRGTFTLNSPGDTFLDMRGWGKGYVWINGRNLGRYWKIGPQQTLFVPAGWLRRGRNQVVVLDLEEGGSRSLQGVANPVYETPEVAAAAR